MKKIHLLAIDNQNDFCDPTGALYVKGADKDAKTAAKILTKLGDEIDSVSITLDSHFPVHIAHGLFWTDSKGNEPAPFTQITENDVRSGKWRTRNPAWQDYGIFYTSELAKKARYALTI